MNNLTRNAPIALVVGAAGFIGSHLVEKLLSKNIQVIGIDDFSSGKKENLEHLINKKRFKLINQKMEDCTDLETDKVDYAFFTINSRIAESHFLTALEKFIKVCKQYNCKILLVSSLTLYDPEIAEDNNLGRAEDKLIEVGKENRLNVRFVRLTSVYGDRMRFNEDDPIIKLIYYAAKGMIEKEVTPLDFTTRAIFIDDAINLIIKTILHGGTANKIYDGALSYPIKVSEVRQILLDPIWHEKTAFKATSLPPWSSPNLEKTQKEINWQTKTGLIESLKQTLLYFKEHPQYLKPEWDEETAREVVGTQQEDIKVEDIKTKQAVAIEEIKKESHQITEKVKLVLKDLRKGAIILIILAIVGYGLVLPVVVGAWQVINIPKSINNAAKYLDDSNIEKSLLEAKMANLGVDRLSIATSLLNPLVKNNLSPKFITETVDLVEVLKLYCDSQEKRLQATYQLTQVIDKIVGEERGEENNFFSEIKLALDNSSQKNDIASAKLTLLQKKGASLAIIGDWQKKLAEKLSGQQHTNGSLLSLTETLEQLSTIQKGSVVILLVDNSQLTYGGGKIVSLARLDLNKGKLVGLKVEAIEDLDKKLLEVITPPIELQKDLGLLKWGIGEANFDPDYPTVARLVESFYSKETNQKLSGVIMIDLTTLSKLLEATGPVTISGGKEKVNAQSLLLKNLTLSSHAFVSDVFQESLNRIFFLHKLYFQQTSNILEDAITQKHLRIYFIDPKLLAYSYAQNWVGEFPRPAKEGPGAKEDFLAISENHLLGNSSAYYLKRGIKLEGMVQTSGEISHKLTINYLNQSSQQNLQGGEARFRIKIYLNSGSRLIKASFDKKDVISEISSFSDYGRAGYSLVLSVLPGEQKELELEYTENQLVDLKQASLKYHLTVFKQLGTEETPFELSFKYPNNYQVTNLAKGEVDSQTVKVTSNLSQDQQWVINLQKK